MNQVAPVTVVVNACNAPACLPVTLQSLQQQTTPPEAIVVVDQGSTDDTVAIAERGGATVIGQALNGSAAARNQALALATTQFVAFLDAKDWYVPDKIERSIECLTELQASCMATDAWVVRGDRIEGRQNARRAVPGVLTKEHLLRGNPVICSSVVATRAAIVAVGGFDEDPDLVASEDYDLWLRLAQREPIAYVGQPMTFYRSHDVGSANSAGYVRGVDRILERVARQHPGEAHFANLVRRRRVDVRLDLASDLILRDCWHEARQLIDEADAIAHTWKGLKMRMRALLRR